MPDSQPTTAANESAPQQTATFLPTAATKELRPDEPKAERPTSNLVVPGYRILGMLGRGGMGVVYQALQEKANRTVALKMILAGAHAGEADRVRFNTEAEAAARLAHPNIVQLYEVGETPEGFPYFSLEFVGGGTLADRLKQGPLSPPEAAALVESLARAMQYAHERGIVHRDLKPANVLLQKDEGGRRKDESGTDTAASGSSFIPHPSSFLPKISDFGLAKQLGTEDGMTRTGAIMGTPSYMAPEQAFGHSKHVGPPADIYALGAILYECLTGRPPFQGATIADTLEQVRTMEPVAPRSLVKEVPRDLETICLHCLHKDPQRRYASAEALAGDLGRFREGLPIAVRPVGTPERVWRWCRRNPWWATAIATVVLMALTIMAGLTYGIVKVNALNDAVTKEAERKEEQRKQADAARTEADTARQLSEKRLDQSVAALKLFATDARTFCEDAMVPGVSRRKLYDLLAVQLEKQAAAGEDREFSDDVARSRIFMYEAVALAQIELGRIPEAETSLKKGLELADQWVAARPDEPGALSRRASVLHLFGITNDRRRNFNLAQRYFTEAYEIRKQLVGNEKVERFTPAKTRTDLADSLDDLKRFDEAIQVRQEAHQQVLEHIAKVGGSKEDAYATLDAWCWTYWKAAQSCQAPRDYLKMKEYLAKAAEKSLELSRLRKEGRPALVRWAEVERTFGDLEYQQGELAARDNQSGRAKEHFTASKTHYAKLGEITRGLATSDDLFKQRRQYGDSFYDLARIEKKLGQDEPARQHFTHCLQVREELIRDYPQSPYSIQLKIDVLDALVGLGRYAEAAGKADQMAIRYVDKITMSRLARLYARCITAVEEARRPDSLTSEDRALQAAYREMGLRCLDDAIKSGFDEWDYILTHPDLSPLRDDPKFKTIQDRIKQDRRGRKGRVGQDKPADTASVRAPISPAPRARC
jgi:serine/threonine protein kinase/tetratricopeptide (TPR) repeat protein